MSEVMAILDHRSNDAGELEYKIDHHLDSSGQVQHIWVGKADVGPALLKTYEMKRLKVDRKNKQKRQRAWGMVAPPLGPDHVLGEDSDDQGACQIDKAKILGNVKKYQRRRLGGIIAAV